MTIFIIFTLIDLTVSDYNYHSVYPYYLVIHIHVIKLLKFIYLLFHELKCFTVVFCVVIFV